ncbi:Glucose-repressible alcohol dehydrogenase transcriptional effector CCR4 and related proteins [Plasmopara halstedii]|uniref:Glucose-repressible alcohol dehydrogenase transcriptional effector CCR4 and related proteins n=1 Tax=Plasmopara halstedii TaxID=4781 RepID=A0A0N7L3T1_PLAHL|nr:Glucose-repressible alcohol dehydrogenase transcriptional effector CCR4 and related proteins [Plasmopara halstedii]CEG36739.1 Glucose-repressible alcohol dehydrogenase transcriptional effector CCR4 and related proteins [Plasmopara halstedii]|eukprot:XP_024573108.1 Glucose-repressible alcohol dehydrogenase transcriptional effector CCR4 and related proteins [Plasmopara halstedii]
MSVTLSGRPTAVCLGMGAAVLASVSLSRHNVGLWQAFRRASANCRARRNLYNNTNRCTHEQLLPCTVEQGQINSNRLSKQKITVVQLNILASNLATRNHFPYVLESSLNWENRKMTLLRQLDALDADVLCLEELSDYWTFFKPELQHRGYDSVYLKRPSIHVSNWSGEKKHDGCGIFYKKEKFELKEFEAVNYHDPHDRVAVLALLKMRKFAQFVLIGCTHLWWNAKKVDHQMAELYELEEEIIRMSSDVQDKYNHDLAKTLTGQNKVPIVLCGDFNNSPESPIYDYMENSFMQKPNLEGISEIFRSAYAFYKPNALASALKSSDEAIDVEEGKKSEPPHTTVNYRRCWTIDYIWYTKSSLVPSRVLAIPPESELRAEDGPGNWFNRLVMSDNVNRLGRLPSGLHGNYNGIPNSVYGSDHVPIMAEFEFLCATEEKLVG